MGKWHHHRRKCTSRVGGHARGTGKTTSKPFSARMCLPLAKQTDELEAGDADLEGVHLCALHAHRQASRVVAVTYAREVRVRRVQLLDEDVKIGAADHVLPGLDPAYHQPLVPQIIADVADTDDRPRRKRRHGFNC